MNAKHSCSPNVRVIHPWTNKQNSKWSKNQNPQIQNSKSKLFFFSDKFEPQEMETAETGDEWLRLAEVRGWEIDRIKDMIIPRTCCIGSLWNVHYLLLERVPLGRSPKSGLDWIGLGWIVDRIIKTKLARTRHYHMWLAFVDQAHKFPLEKQQKMKKLHRCKIVRSPDVRFGS